MGSVKLPFELPPTYGGDGRPSVAAGRAEISESGVALEYGFKTNLWIGMVGSDEAQEARLDLPEIRSVGLKTGRFGDRLVVEVTSFSAANGIPGSKEGRVELKVPRREREAAKQAESLLAAALARREIEGLKRELGRGGDGGRGE